MIQVTAPFPYRDVLGEGPLWDATDGTLLRVDYLGKAVHRLDIHSGAQHTIAMPEEVAFGIPTSSGEVIVGQRSSVQLVGGSGDLRRTLVAIDLPDMPLRINDGKVDPLGRLVFGTLSETRSSNASCYRLGERLDTLFDGVVISNGLAWDLSRRRFYYVDSWTGRIDVCDFDAQDGAVSNRRPFAIIPESDGLPDGIAVDEEGCLWVALFGGGAVRRYRPDGTRDLDIKLPVSYPTSVAFGGDDLRTMFITSSFHRLDDEERQEQPLAGALLVCEPGVAGAPEFGAGPHLFAEQ